MTHKRWVEKSKTFPRNKYSFTEHLTRVGDWVRTHPMGLADCKRFRDAAYEWAWHKGWRVSVNRFRVAEALWECICTLKAKHRIREYT